MARSIISEDERCFLCGRTGYLHRHHCLSGSYRKAADKEGLIVPLCPNCHNLVHSSYGTSEKKHLEKIAQETWEAKYPERNWLEVIGRNFK